MSATDSPSGQEPEGQEGNQGQAPEAKDDSPKADVPVDTFPRDYVERLRSENADHRRKATEALERLEEIEARDKTDAEKASNKAAKEAARADAAEAKLLRFAVANEKGIPADAVDLLSGSTREELEGQADRILALAKQSSQTPDFDGGTRDSAPEAQTPEEGHRDLLMGLFGRNPT